MQPERIGAPSAGIVSLVEAKEHLRIIDNDENQLIERTILAATEAVEKMANQAFALTTYKIVFREFSDSYYLPYTPLSSISTVKYFDSANAEQTVSDSDYLIDKPNARLYFDCDYSAPGVYDRHDAVQIEYVSGYAAALIPSAAKSACLLVLSDLYENREGQVIGLMVSPNLAVKRLIHTLREHRL